MKIMRVINDELIDLREFKKPNLVFNTNEYSDSEDLCIFHEQINPFDLYYENKEKEKEIERLNNIINELEKWCLSWKENDKFCYLSSNDKDKCRYDIWGEVLDKLKELKGADKE